jgi:hypothetical protein
LRAAEFCVRAAAPPKKTKTRREKLFMKICPICRRTFDGAELFCVADAVVLPNSESLKTSKGRFTAKTDGKTLDAAAAGLKFSPRPAPETLEITTFHYGLVFILALAVLLCGGIGLSFSDVTGGETTGVVVENSSSKASEDAAHNSNTGDAANSAENNKTKESSNKGNEKKPN